jgi:hypothetical protein
MNLSQVEQVAQCSPRPEFQTRNITRDFILVERPPNSGQEAGQFSRELRPTVGFLREVQKLLANQVIKRTLRAESSLHSFRRPTLIDPNLFESNAHLGQYTACRRELAAPALL